MRNILLLPLLLLVCCKNGMVSYNAQNADIHFTDVTYADTTDMSGDGAILKFEGRKCCFGTVNRREMQKLSIGFAFENAGNTPLIIYKVDVSCDCLASEFSQKPVMPGDGDTVSIFIDTKTRKGNFNKTGFVKSNARNDVELLRITGYLK